MRSPTFSAAMLLTLLLSPALAAPPAKPATQPAKLITASHQVLSAVGLDPITDIDAKTAAAKEKELQKLVGQKVAVTALLKDGKRKGAKYESLYATDTINYAGGQLVVDVLYAIRVPENLSVRPEFGKPEKIIGTITEVAFQRTGVTGNPGRGQSSQHYSLKITLMPSP